MMRLKNMVRGMENNSPAKQLIKLWDHDDETLKFWRASSNFVYLFYKEGLPYYLRFIHEEDNSIGNIQAEIDFILFVIEAGFPAVSPIRSNNGCWIETVSTETGCYHGVVFNQAEGVHVPLDQMSDFHYEEWGKSLAALHEIFETYKPDPSGVARKSWIDILETIRIVLSNYPQELEAEEECNRLQRWLNSLPSGAGHTGLIHYDFQTDNVFYVEQDSRFSAIDFDDSMYHWFMMDITSALLELIEQNDDEAEAAIRHFLKGYQSVKYLDLEYLDQMSRFQRFDSLYMFSRLLRCLENMDIPNLPDWMVRLIHKLQSKCDQFRKGFKLPW